MGAAQPSGRNTQRHDGLTHPSSTRTLSNRARRPNIRKHRRRRALSARAVSFARSRAWAPRTTDTVRAAARRRKTQTGHTHPCALVHGTRSTSLKPGTIYSYKVLGGCQARALVSVRWSTCTSHLHVEMDKHICVDGQHGLHGRHGGPAELAEWLSYSGQPSV